MGTGLQVTQRHALGARCFEWLWVQAIGWRCTLPRARIEGDDYFAHLDTAIFAHLLGNDPMTHGSLCLLDRPGDQEAGRETGGAGRMRWARDEVQLLDHQSR